MIPASERETLPEETGVYLLYGEKKLLYVGKAKNIRRRIQDHFRAPQVFWMHQVDEIDCVLLEDETEALLLERELIASRKPRYNIRLRDDRSYPMIAISLDEEFPRVYISREKMRPDRMYFGPWTDAKRARNLLRVLPEVFPFRSCSGSKPGRAQNPCLDFYIDRCGAPCVQKISKKEYRRGIEKIIRFLRGERQVIEKREAARMEEAAQKKDYERAALHRDRLRAIRKLSGSEEGLGPDRNVLAAYSEESEVSVAVLEIREGRIAEARTLLFDNEQDLPLDEVLRQVSETLDEAPVVLPGNAEDTKLLETAERNARMQLRYDRSRRSEGALRVDDALEDLQGQSGKPLRIEGYDVANLGADATVGGMVVFEEGVPRSKQYRVFPLQREKKPDDYQSLRETITKRVELYKQHSEMSPWDPARDSSLAERPDLMLIDGGRGQLGVALQAAKPFLEEGTEIIALAKKEETPWDQNGQRKLAAQGLMLLQRVRDEVHFLANSRHQDLRQKKFFASPLQGIDGVGPKTEKKLLARFGSLRGIAEASEEDLLEMVPRATAKKIREALQKNS